MKNTVELVSGYIKQQTGERPNATLIRSISDKLRKDSFYKDEFDVYLGTIRALRFEYGYHLPSEKQADRNDMDPFLAALNKGLSKENK
jgi:hypothetical protein